MNRSHLSIKFYLKEKSGNGLKKPIYMRLIFERKKAEHFTGIYIHEKKWNEESQRAKKDSVINDRLANIEADVRDIMYKLKKEEKQVSAAIIKDIYTGKQSLKMTLIVYFQLYNERQTNLGELDKNTISRYKDTNDHINKFLKQQNQTSYQLSSIDFKFISDFDFYLKKQISHISGKQLVRNTVNKHHSRLRTLLNRAVNEGILTKNPYQQFKFKYTPSTRTFLTQAELEKITSSDLGGNISLIKIRDIFIFSVYTGLRFNDAQSIKPNQIEKDSHGNFYLSTIQNKTGVLAKVPLLKPAIQIINKYKELSVITGQVLPKISNQKFNTYLKLIGDMAGITKILSHHVARHTCATTVLLSNEAPIEAVSKWLGHTNIRTTQIYAKITNDYLQEVAENISSKIK